MAVLVSACVMGVNCKYNGKNNLDEVVKKYLKDEDIIMVCPEMMANLGCPRACIEMVGKRIMDNTGNDVTDVLNKAANDALIMLADKDIEYCVLQSRSPTCGCGHIYDGSFKGKLIAGDGVFAALLKEKGYVAYDVGTFRELIIKKGYN